MQLPNHGANPQNLLSALGMKAPKDSIDFSVNTNPLGTPAKIEQNWNAYLDKLKLYPDPNHFQLKQALAEANDVALDTIMIGNGAAEIIFLLTNYFRSKRALIIEPTFSEYRDACYAYHCSITTVSLSANDEWSLPIAEIEKNLPAVDFMFLCHPNNPTGCTYEQTELLYLLEMTKKNHVHLIIDEAFYDFCEDNISVVTKLSSYQHVIVLRSLTKMYGIAGIRLGYAIASPEIISAVTKQQHPWNVNGVAQQIGLTCLEEKNFVKETVSFIGKESNRVRTILNRLGFETSQSAVNYYLLKEKKQEKDLLPLLTFLIQSGIIPRHTYNFTGLDGKYLRLAVKKKEENDRLLSVLERWKQR